MEVIHMSEDTKKNWARKFFTEADMKEFEEIGKAPFCSEVWNFIQKATEAQKQKESFQ
jgi:hypothetical protein